MVVWATTKGGTVKPAAALRGVNKKLRTMVEATRTWHKEWVDGWMERMKMQGSLRGKASLEVRKQKLHREDDCDSRMPSTGRWTMAGRASRPKRTGDHGCSASAARRRNAESDPDPAVRARPPPLRGEHRRRQDVPVIAQLAKRMTKPEPLLWTNLTGRCRPGEEDAAWEALKQPEALCRLGLCHQWPQ